MADLLDIVAVKSTNDKVDRVEFHPVQPWLVFVTRGNGVTVWNYESNEVIYENELGGAGEAALQEAALQQRAEKDPAYYGENSYLTGTAAEASLAAKSTASGAVKDVKFFDLDTCFWQLARQHRMQHNVFDSSTIPPFGRSGGISALHGRRWLVMACESKLVLHDLASWDSCDLSRSALLDSKAPTCLAFLLYNMPQLMGYDVGNAPLWFPLLAVGTSGGSIYIINHEKMVVYAKLSGAHGKAVTALVPIGGETPGSPDMLISAAADGSVAVWNPSHATFRGADREMAAKLVFKAHEASVHSMTLFSSYSEGSQPPTLKLATAGDDKRVTLWDTRTWKQLGQSKPLQKGSCHSVGFAPWGGAALGVHPSLVLCTGEAPVVLGLNPSNGGVMIFADLAGRIEAGQKKTPKIYHAAIHSTRPTLMAVASNTGAVLLSFDPHQRPPVVALPPQVLTLEGLLHSTEKKEQAAASAAGGGSAPGSSKGAQALTYVMALGSTLFSTALRLESKSRPGGGTPGGVAAPERSVHIETGVREAIGQLDHSGRVVLGCSTSGRSLSVVWPELRAYTIFSLAPTGSWEVIDKGSGNCVVWSSTQAMYAVISVPNIPALPSPKQKKGLFSRGRKKKEEEEAAAEAAAARAAAAATSVQVHVVNESSATQFVATHEVPLAGEQPVVLHGGALLGVVLNKRSATGRAFQFVNWKGFGAVGPELPEPLWVSWEPECTLMALAYAHTIELCRTRPCFERFASLSIGDAQSGIWQSRQLFVSTPTSIHAIFADPVQQFVQAVQLASFQGGASSKLTQAGELTPLPPEDMRPAGPLVLAGVRHSYLWLADGLGRPFTLSLRHPGIRLRALAARGELSTARTIAQRGLHPAFHDDVARFLAAMSPQDGVREALLLSGLTPPAEMALSIRAGKWDRAARCFQALALGVADKAVLALAAEGGAGGREMHSQRSGMPVSETYQEDAVNEILEQHATGGAPGLAGLLSLSPPSPQHAEQGGQAQQGQQAQHNGLKASGGDEGRDDWEGAEEEGEGAVDAVDWEAPLRPAVLEGEEGHREGEGAAAGGGGKGARRGRRGGQGGAQAGGEAVDVAEARRVAAMADLGLRFAEAAAEEGHLDAARSALGVLVRYAPQLPPALLEDLVYRMGQCSMTESARNLARAVTTAPTEALQDPGVAALLAALVGGRQGKAVAGTLQAAGLSHLAAVYGAVWGSKDAVGAVTEWQRELAAAGALDAPAGQIAITPPLA